MPGPDGYLHIYKLPTGQGGAHIIQCPDGDLTVFDQGANDEGDPRFMQGTHIQQFLTGQTGRVRNVVFSHNHLDHYNMIANTFPNSASIPNLQNIYISCTANDMASGISSWVTAVGGSSKVRTFNNGGMCGPVGPSCGDIPLCPNSAGVRGQVLAANLGQHCTDGGNKNMDSIYLKISYGSFSAHLQGDFEDETTSATEDGPHQWLVDFYGSQLQATVYSLSHHGASTYANKGIIRNAVRPKAVWSNGNPWYSYYHPRCVLFDEFINLGSLCKPGVTDTSSQYYCGAHIYPSVPTSQRVQTTYTCGGSTEADRQQRNNNDWAFYTTVPDQQNINIIKLSTNGNSWGFTTDIFATP